MRWLKIVLMYQFEILNLQGCSKIHLEVSLYSHAKMGYVQCLFRMLNFISVSLFFYVTPALAISQFKVGCFFFLLEPKHCNLICFVSFIYVESTMYRDIKNIFSCDYWAISEASSRDSEHHIIWAKGELMILDYLG